MVGEWAVETSAVGACFHESSVLRACRGRRESGQWLVVRGGRPHRGRLLLPSSSPTRSARRGLAGRLREV